jgi:hypothetical protein
VTHDDFIRLYDVEGYGVVSRANAVFVQHCTDLNSVDSLAVNAWALIRFHSGMGNSTLIVKRVA